ncbi:hypothetical protein Sinac_0595 [Singulisphaera acidiphila DSM 18658]|uniref:Uncharacterized protein n=1 Tax=Singulisphaera acidiphila (strain ATCC BAA-1392 / DSM 18658 / VKM B-2454 / MOB10) TaxID=886293 RepID=L0D702_SINAD|nr:hypothetical protein Sinac_0595 [Singulisphaera acidiphila DSM 18658]
MRSLQLRKLFALALTPVYFLWPIICLAQCQATNLASIFDPTADRTWIPASSSWTVQLYSDVSWQCTPNTDVVSACDICVSTQTFSSPDDDGPFTIVTFGPTGSYHSPTCNGRTVHLTNGLSGLNPSSWYTMAQYAQQKPADGCPENNDSADLMGSTTFFTPPHS